MRSPSCCCGRCWWRICSPCSASFGRDLQPWLPFNASTAFYAGGDDFNPFGANAPTWWQGGLVFAATAVVLLVLALASAKRRDA